LLQGSGVFEALLVSSWLVGGLGRGLAAQSGFFFFFFFQGKSAYNSKTSPQGKEAERPACAAPRNQPPLSKALKP
jgi:hypothetical protein